MRAELTRIETDEHGGTLWECTAYPEGVPGAIIAFSDLGPATALRYVRKTCEALGLPRPELRKDNVFRRYETTNF